MNLVSKRAEIYSNVTAIIICCIEFASMVYTFDLTNEEPVFFSCRQEKNLKQ